MLEQSTVFILLIKHTFSCCLNGRKIGAKELWCCTLLSFAIYIYVESIFGCGRSWYANHRDKTNYYYYIFVSIFTMETVCSVVCFVSAAQLSTSERLNWLSARQTQTSWCCWASDARRFWTMMALRANARAATAVTAHESRLIGRFCESEMETCASARGEWRSRGREGSTRSSKQRHTAEIERVSEWVANGRWGGDPRSPLVPSSDIAERFWYGISVCAA